ncbi:DsbA family oxidoreductase [Halobellus limi]|uniref:DsbA family protein n=1 Tax=Halobellus limi TaxID=699433 RepID=A0A1H6BS95_9EURY|nr:DsbA family protein [Halobellus limi]QCC49341.1 DsbA family protein [Halobellus limi]SEG63579.1 Predicted dithiol-disulfide isomerase, DsbA family [Halobellus limi]
MASTDTEDGRPTITQFTDPMCTWCWGSEPIIRRLRTALGNQVEFRYIMGGLVEDFDEFYDTANDIAAPSDVAPHWEEASQYHGMPVDTQIFETDPAQSTYPASKAFTAARQQDTELAHRYLRRLREAYTTQVRNVNRREEQVKIAESVGLDVDDFTTALDNGTAQAAFEKDLARTRQADVRAFPTYHIDGPAGETKVSGFQSFEELVTALKTVDPTLEQSSPPPITQFIAAYEPVATREVAEVYELDEGKARQALESFVDDGSVRREARGNGFFWYSKNGGES